MLNYDHRNCEDLLFSGIYFVLHVSYDSNIQFHRLKMDDNKYKRSALLVNGNKQTRE